MESAANRQIPPMSNLHATIDGYFEAIRNNDRQAWLDTFSDDPALIHIDPVGAPARNTKAEISALVELLGKWGETKAPDPLRAKYGKLAWEFTSAGQLSQPASGPSVTGPAANEQSLIPDEIKKARFVLYMIEHDGSYGVHNARFSTASLKEAKTLVESKLAE